MASMDAEFTEEEVVENPTLKAAYNLAPLHQNQPLRWDYEVDLIGKTVYNKVIHLCERCELPILVYGRLLPCKDIFCFLCARKCGTHCKRPGCGIRIQKLEELALDAVHVCTFGTSKHSVKGCRKSYLSQRDLQSHIAHRHLNKQSTDSKSNSSAQQPQLPLTQQQAAALQQQQHGASQVATSTFGQDSQSNLLLPSSSMHNQQSQQQQQQQILSTSPFMQQHLHQPSPHANPVSIPGLGVTSVTPAISQASSADLKPNPMMHHSQAMTFNPSHPTNVNDPQGIYRSVDTTSLSHQFQQQQQQQAPPPPPLHQQQQQQHLQIPMSQHHQVQSQQQSPQMMRHAGGSPGMPPMSKQNLPMPRFSQPMSSSMLPTSLQSKARISHPFQTSNSGSPAEMQMSTQMHHHPHHQGSRQNVNVNLQQQQQQQSQPMIPPQQRLMQKNYEMHSDVDNAPYDRHQPLDSFGNSSRHNMDNSNDNMAQGSRGGGGGGMDNFPGMQQRKLFNPHQDLDDRERMFNPRQQPPPSMMDTSNTPPPPPNPQGGVGQSARNKNVNLITVPIQDEGQYRPLPYVNQSQLSASPSPAGGGVGANKNFPPFSSASMSSSVSHNPSANFSSVMNMNSQVGVGGGVRPSSQHRMPFNRPMNPMSQQDSPQGNLNPNLMLNNNNNNNNNPRGMGVGGGGGGSSSNVGIGGNAAGGNRLTLGANMPPNVQGALAGAVQALTHQHNPRFNAPPGHWAPGGGSGGGGNLRPIQPRLTQNLPPSARGTKGGEGQYKQQQGYYR